MVQLAYLECRTCNTWNYDVRRGRCSQCDAVVRAAAGPGWLVRAGLAAFDAVCGGEPARVTPRHAMMQPQWVSGGIWNDTGKRVTRLTSRTLFGLRLTRATRVKPVLRFTPYFWPRTREQVDADAAMHTALSQHLGRIAAGDAV